MITSAGIGSGIDIESIISQLMILENQPLNKLRKKQASLDVQVSAFGKLKSAISELEDSAAKLGENSEFGRYTASSSNEEVFTAIATTGTAAEFHDIEVLSLAENHRLASAAFTSAGEAVGTGSYTFSAGDDLFDVTISTANNSLTGMRDAINDSPDNNTISASIINVDGGSRLVLTSKTAGTANAITAPAMFSEIEAAKDAELIIDGFTVTHSSNTVTDVIPGVTLNLIAAGSGELSTNRDTDSIRESLAEFAEKYNTLKSTIDSLGTSTLKGESLLLNIESRIRQQFFTPVDLGNTETTSPFELGFTFDKKGILSIDDKKLTAAIDTDIERLVSSIADSSNGFARQIETSLKAYTNVDGLIGNKTDGLDRRNESLDSQADRLEYRISQTEVRYRRRFSALDTLVSQLTTTSDYMTQQLNALNNMR